MHYPKHIKRFACQLFGVAFALFLFAIVGAGQAAAANIYYSTSDDTIYVKPTSNNLETITLSDIRNALGDNKHLEETSSGHWYLKDNLFIKGDTKDHDLRLLIDSSVKQLYLKSDSSGFVWLKAYNADVIIKDTNIISWDQAVGSPDTKLSDGRAFILAKYNSRLDILSSEVSYLGYHSGEAYGIAWRIAGGTKGKYYVTGQVENSDFHHNYYGLYTFGADDMVFRGNRIHHNVQYGLDPHDDSNGFLVEDNDVYENGNHGIIFSVRCVNNIIRNNRSYNNALSGIMLDRFSNHNTVTGNTASGNVNGVALYGSHDNTIKNNDVYGNQRGILAKDQSKDNLITANSLHDQLQYGIYFYGGASGNTITNNTVTSSARYGVYLKESGNTVTSNIIEKNRKQGVVLRSAHGSLVENNQIMNNTSHGLYLYGGSENNTIKNNILSANGGRGLYLKYADNNTVSNNDLIGNGSYGILAYSSHGNIFSQDSFSGNYKDYYYAKGGSLNTVKANSDVTAKVGDSTSKFILANDSRQALENNKDIPSIISASQSSLTVLKQHVIVRAEPIALQVTPASNQVAINVVAWDTAELGDKHWQASGDASFTVSDLSPGTQYLIKVDGAEEQIITTNQSGSLSFSGTGTHSYEVKR